MSYDPSRRRRDVVSRLKYKTGYASKKQIDSCGGEFSHFETEGKVTYEVYRLPDGNLLKTASTPTYEERQRSNSMAFFPTKEQREKRRALREQQLKEQEKEKK